jgi:GNAT superfamily N-acetyltransferase
MQFHALADIQRPLLDKFYRAHHGSMRSKGEAQAWVAKEGEIVGALSLRPMAHGHWLTGLFVAPEQRGKGIAKHLITAATASVSGPVWLFCEPDLLGFYQLSGFVETTDLPEALADRLARYRRSKTLVALVRLPLALQRLPAVAI